MELRNIAVDNFNTNIFNVLNRKWMLLSSGDFHVGKYNCMTVSWGFMGTFWFKPMVIAGVRPQRFTCEFMKEYDSFTLCAFPETFRQALSFCGANSGRETDKFVNTGLIPTAAEKVSAPVYEQAELIIECEKIYADRLKGKNFIAKKIIADCYGDHSFHEMFFGEVLAVRGTAEYCRKTANAE